MGLIIAERGSFTSIADKIRSLSDIVGGIVFPNGFVTGVQMVRNKGEKTILEKQVQTYVYEGNEDVRLGPYAFAGNTNLTTVTLPNLYTPGVGNRLPKSCFEGCTALTDVSVKNGLSIVSNIVWPGDNSFYGCTSLASIGLNKSNSIGNYAFYGCTSLSNVFTSGGSVSTQTRNRIGNYAFYNCSSLSSFSGYGNLEALGDYAFSKSGLTSFSSSPYFNGSYTIGARAFEDCQSLSSVDLTGVRSIGEYAFAGCTSLTSITIPRSCTSIGAHAFEGCANLQTVILSTNNYAYSSASIGEYAFSQCTALEEIEIPGCYHTIGNSAFSNCNKLRTVTFAPTTMQDGSVLMMLDTIGSYAFYRCTSLDKIVIPDTVTSIGNYAFRENSKLRYMRFLGDTPPNFGSVILYNTAIPGSSTFIGIFVPDSEEDEVLEDYSSAGNFSTYARYIRVWDGTIE